MFRFKDEDLLKYKNKEPKWGPIGLVTFKRTYARPKYDAMGVQCDTESWLDTCVRVLEGNMNIIQDDPTATREWALLALDLMYNMAWTPAGRGLWMSGSDYQLLRGGDALVNCWWVEARPQSYEDMEMFKGTYVFSDPEKPMPSFPFVFMFDRAMLGGGVGFSVARKCVSQFTKVNNRVNLIVSLDSSHPDWDRILDSEEWERIQSSMSTSRGKLKFTDAPVKPSPKGITAIKIPDSREGWDIAVRELIDAHWYNDSEDEGISVLLDLSDIRGYGTPIKGFGGTASGPLPLIDALVLINNILNSKVDEYLESVDVVDITNLLGRCVVSGNVRRTALIALGDADDKSYVNAKNYKLVESIIDINYGNYGWYKNKWGRDTQKLKSFEEIIQIAGSAKEAHKLVDIFHKQENHRWASNNSVYTYELFEDFHFIAAGMMTNGEPGEVNKWLIQNFGRIKDGYKKAIDGKATGVNPCGEVTLENGEPCNLAEGVPYICWLYGYNIYDVLKIETMYTYRVTFAKYAWPISDRVIKKNRRIGVSLTGLQDYFLSKYGHYAVKGYEDDDITKPIFYPEIEQELSDWYEFVVSVNDEHAKALGETPSIKRTTCKPSGTIAKLMGVSAGIHWHYAPYIIQRIRFATTDPNLAVMKLCGFPIEKDAKVPNTMVVEFPVKAPNADNPNFKSAGDVPLEEQFANQYLFAYAWADNAVSATLTFQPEEAAKIEYLLKAYKNKIKSTSLLPYSGHGYVQAPWEPISKEEYERRIKQIKMPMEQIYRALKIKDMSELLDSDCSTGACPIR